MSDCFSISLDNIIDFIAIILLDNFDFVAKNEESVFNRNVLNELSNCKEKKTGKTALNFFPEQFEQYLCLNLETKGHGNF